jgi:hypothetical protein
VRTPTIRLALALLLALPLAACGGKSEQGSGSAGSQAQGGAASPQAQEDGAASPQDLVKRMQAATKAKDFAQVLPLIHPDQRGGFAFLMGAFAPQMFIGMSEGLLGMAGMGGTDAAAKAKAKAEAKAKLDKMKKDWQALLDKHGVKIDEAKVKETMSSLGSHASEADKRAAMRTLGEMMGHADYAAFLRDSAAFLDSHSEKKDGDSSGVNWNEFSMQDATVNQDGDKATVTVTRKGKPGKPMGLVKHNGRWYLDLATME